MTKRKSWYATCAPALVGDIITFSHLARCWRVLAVSPSGDLVKVEKVEAPTKKIDMPHYRISAVVRDGILLDTTNQETS